MAKAEKSGKKARKPSAKGASKAGKREEAPKDEKKIEAPVEPAKAEPREAERKAPKKKKKPQRKAVRAFVARGKRKESVARATIKAGSGVVRINSLGLSSINNPYIRNIIREPLRYVGPGANSVNISVNVTGGGRMGQAQAARTAIANALVMYFDQENLKEKFMEIDRSMLIDDTRRVEAKKFRGPKARARFQKSYR